MGIIDVIKRMSKDKSEFKAKLKEAQEERRIQNLLNEREKSSNRRELERHMREQEEERIKETLNKIHKHENKELWKSKNQILSKGANMLNDDRPILKEKNIFKLSKQKKERGMFFR